MNWSVIPDLTAIVILTCAFVSVARRCETPVSGKWLTGWLAIVLHFAASLFLRLPNPWSTMALIVALCSLVWAGEFFMWAALPFQRERSTRVFTPTFIALATLYIWQLATLKPAWMLNLTAVSIGIVPLALAHYFRSEFKHPIRWIRVTLQCLLSVFLLFVQHRPRNGDDIAMNALLFSVFFGCSWVFALSYRRATTGAFITVAGFLTWASVFLISPLMQAYYPLVHVQSEVWNLPKYLVAVGMILLLLEEQIDYNRHLALHDELTDLPNRRLFQDRLANAIERARRTKENTALLVVDLDRFKHVNDTMGHHIGDLLLQHVASAFIGRVRRSDTVARTGGDEFSVILEEPTNREDAERVGKTLIHLLKEPIELEGHWVHTGASVGIALFPEDAASVEALCIAADLRMYDDKHKVQHGIEHSHAKPVPVHLSQEQSTTAE